MTRVNHKKVRQLLNQERNSITDRQFFVSRILAGHFADIAAAQSKRYAYNRRVNVRRARIRTIRSSGSMRQLHW